MAIIIQFPERETAFAEGRQLSDPAIEHLSAAGDAIVSASKTCQGNIVRLTADLDRLERLACLIENEQSRTALQVLIATKRTQLASASLRLVKQTSYFRSVLSNLRRREAACQVDGPYPAPA
jgi:hypothetical protein